MQQYSAPSDLEELLSRAVFERAPRASHHHHGRIIDDAPSMLSAELAAILASRGGTAVATSTRNDDLSSTSFTSSQLERLLSASTTSSRSNPAASQQQQLLLQLAALRQLGLDSSSTNHVFRTTDTAIADDPSLCQSLGIEGGLLSSLRNHAAPSTDAELLLNALLQERGASLAMIAQQRDSRFALDNNARSRENFESMGHNNDMTTMSSRIFHQQPNNNEAEALASSSIRRRLDMMQALGSFQINNTAPNGGDRQEQEIFVNRLLARMMTAALPSGEGGFLEGLRSSDVLSASDSMLLAQPWADLQASSSMFAGVAPAQATGWPLALQPPRATTYSDATLPIAVTSNSLQAGSHQQAAPFATVASMKKRASTALDKSEEEEDEEFEKYIESLPTNMRDRRVYRHEAFPQKLYRMLMEMQDKPGPLARVVCFTESGKGFRVNNPQVFESHIGPLYFRHAQYSSFRRQLSTYGFKRCTHGSESGAICHLLFRKGRPELLPKIVRVSELREQRAKEKKKKGNTSTTTATKTRPRSSGVASITSNSPSASTTNDMDKVSR